MTPLAGRVISENRGLVATLAVALVANVLAWGLIVRPLRATSTGAEDRAAAAASALKAAEAEMAQAEGLVSGKKRADDELDAFYKKVLPADLTSARRMTYASLPALARKTGVTYQARTTEVAPVDRDGHLEKMSIRMVLEGSYGNMRQFLYELEMAPEFVIIDDVTITQGQANEPLRLTVDLATYYLVTPSAS